MSKRHSIILVIGLVLFAPSLRAGFLLDDFYYLGAVEGRFPEYNTKRSLFPFFINDEEATAAIAARGGYPWWIDERVRGETFRPLSDLLIRADHGLYEGAPLGYHIHSLAWWAATLLACGLVMGRALRGGIAAVALLLFALDEVHVMPVTWIANRNALVALAPMLFGLWAWMRWCETRWRPGRWLALAGIVIGLAGGELGVAVLAYFVAYTLLGAPPTSVRARLRRLAPIAALGVAYALTYRLLGFDSSGSGAYHDPIHDPVGFLRGVATGVPTLLASGIAGFGADFWFAVPSLRPAQIIVGSLATVGLLGLLRSCWPDVDDATRRGVRWLLTGSALSLIPATAVFPSDRMLLVPGVGLAAALATVLVQAYRSRRTRRRWLLVGAGGYLALVHLLVAPVLAVGLQTLLTKHGRESLELAASPVVAGAGGKEAILVFAPDHVVSLYLPVMIDHLGRPAPKGWRPLSIAPYDHRLTRSGPRTLELEVAGGGVMLRSIFEALYRDPRDPLSPGTVVERGLLSAEILAANDRGPTRVAFHLDRDLSDPSFYFLAWQDGELRRLELPEIGDTLFLKRTLGPGGF